MKIGYCRSPKTHANERFLHGLELPVSRLVMNLIVDHLAQGKELDPLDFPAKS